MTRSTIHACGLAITLLTLSGTASVAVAKDSTSERIVTHAEAMARVEAAERALLEAQAELLAAREEAALLAASTSDADESARATRGSSDQPEDSDAADDRSDLPAPKLGWTEGWDYAFNAGISGSSGNNENFSGRLSLTGERKTERMETTGHASYIYATSEGERSASRGEIGLRNDWLLDGPWRFFMQGMYEYDEFQAWQHRLSGALGYGYEFINNEKTTLIGRVGVGGSSAFGKNAYESLIPEGLLGLYWEHQLSEITKLTATTT
ncbi:MAG: DUF481 domain-containing protein, partial [Phycisphaerales bacterium]|nr:DUF481 domain-containing protein [Phycisphaerales bacterium]